MLVIVVYSTRVPPPSRLARAQTCPEVEGVVVLDHCHLVAWTAWTRCRRHLVQCRPHFLTHTNDLPVILVYMRVAWFSLAGPDTWEPPGRYDRMTREKPQQARP